MTANQRSSRSTAVLGVSAQYHDSAAALVVDGRIVAAAQEERFTRVKGDSALPEGAIEYVLSEARIGAGALSAVAFYESPFAKFDRILSTKMVGRVAAMPTFVSSMASWLPEKLWVAKQLRDIVGKVDIAYCDHHASHAAAAFYPSPFDEAAIVTVDGVGEWTTTSIATGRGDSIELLEQIEYPNSLGLLYSAFTSYCGFKINSGEYKLMGLAPYGTPRFVDTIFEHLIHLDDDGTYALNPAYFEYFDRRRTYGAAFERLLGAPTRRPGGVLTQHYADVAASIQVVTDRVMVALARRAKDRTGAKDLCLSGGVALNVVAVSAIERSGLFDQIWVQPAAGDAGSALGAALWVSHQRQEVARVVAQDTAMSGCLLGPRPEDFGESVDEVLADYGLVPAAVDHRGVAAAVAGNIVAGRVVAVARGRMEFGPRALGNRSILADARDVTMQRRLNLMTKFREGFRPFAPAVLAEDADQYFDMDTNSSPYMLKTYLVRPELRSVDVEPADAADLYQRAQQVRSTLPAVTHVDFSARVQTVEERHNPFLHAVLSEFRDRTGCSVLVNTSFNVRGEPIVSSARDAVECFLHSDVDVLVVGDRVVVKSDQAASALVAKRPSVRGDD
jgi:carbamoyltransferase